MQQLLRAILQVPEAAEAAQALREGCRSVAVTGLAAIHRALLAAALALDTGRVPVLLCADEGEARRLSGDLEALTGQTPLLLGARELYRPAGAVSSREFDHRRIAADGHVADVDPACQRTGRYLIHRKTSLAGAI